MQVLLIPTNISYAWHVMMLQVLHVLDTTRTFLVTHRT